MISKQQQAIISNLEKAELEINRHPDGGLVVRGNGEGINEVSPLIGELENVKTLNLTATDLTDEGFIHLCKLQSTETLELTGGCLTEFALGGVSQMVNLKRVDMQNVFLPGLLPTLISLPRIRSISIIHCGVTDDDMRQVKGSSTLVELSIRHNPIRDEFHSLSRCPALSFLDASITDISRKGGDGISQLDLQTLYLSRTPTCDDMLKSLARLSSLRKLSVRNTNVTEYGSRYLPHFRSLEELKWPSAAFSFNNIENFVRCESLRLLEIWGDVPFSRAEIAEIRNRLINCRVDFE